MDIDPKKETLYLLSDSALNSSAFKMTPQQQAQIQDMHDQLKTQMPPDYFLQLANSVDSDPEMSAAIQKDPRTVFKNAYNIYQSGNVTDPADFKLATAVMKRAQMELDRRNINPQEVIDAENRKAGAAALDTLFKATMVPVNTVAAGVNIGLEGKPVDIWGGRGFEDVIHNQEIKNPLIASAIDKTATGVELTPEEQKAYDDGGLGGYKGQKFWGGLIGNIALDPTMLAGIPLKAATGVSSLAKLRAAKELNTAVHTTDTLRAMGQAAGDIAEAGAKIGQPTEDIVKMAAKLSSDVADTGKAASQAVGNVADAGKYSAVADLAAKLRNADNLTMETAKPILDQISGILGTADRSTNIGKQANVLSKGIAKGLGNLDKTIRTAERIQASPVAGAIADVASLPGKATSAVADVIGRKNRFGKFVGKLFGSDIPVDFRPVVGTKSAGEGIKGLIDDKAVVTAQSFARYIKQMSDKYKVPFKALSDAAASFTEGSKGAVNTALNEIEKLGRSRINIVDKASPFMTDLHGAVAILDKAHDDLMILEATHGVNILPYGITGDDAKEWIKAAADYRTMSKQNRFHTSLDQNEATMRDILKRNHDKVDRVAANARVDLQDSGSIDYLAHIMTKEAKDFAVRKKTQSWHDLLRTGDKMDDSIPVGESIPNVIDPSSIRRSMDMSISDANRLFKSNNGVDFNLFETDPYKIISSRWARASYATKAAVTRDGMADLLKTNPSLFIIRAKGAKGDIPKGFMNISDAFGDYGIVGLPEMENAKAGLYYSAMSNDPNMAKGVVNSFFSWMGNNKNAKELYSGQMFGGVSGTGLNHQMTKDVTNALSGFLSDLREGKLVKLIESPTKLKNYIDDMFKGDRVEIYAPKEVQEGLTNLSKWITPGSGAQVAKDAYDKTLQILKGSLTVVGLPIIGPLANIGFFARNMLGNVLNSLMSGVTPADYLYGMKFAVMKAKQIAENAEIRDHIVTKAGVVLNDKRLIEELSKRGLFGNSNFSAEIRSLVMPHASDSIVGKLGDKADSVLGFSKGTQLNTYLENLSKLGLATALIRQGKSYDEAAMLTKKYLFDYNDLTSFEKGVMKRIFPFYTWVRKNLALQLTHLFNKTPVTVEKIREAISTTADQGSVIDTRQEQGFLKNQPAITLPFTKDQKSRKMSLLMLQGLFPQYDINTIATWMNKDAITMDIVAKANPLVVKLLETAWNISARFRKPVERSSSDKKMFLGMGISPMNYNFLMLTPARHLDNLLNIIAPQIVGSVDHPSWTKEATNAPQMDRWQRVIKLLITTPAQYDERFGRMLAERDARQKISDEVSGLQTELRKTERAYQGTLPPETTMLKYAQAYANIVRLTQEGLKKGVIDLKDKKIGYDIDNLGKEMVLWGLGFDRGEAK